MNTYKRGLELEDEVYSAVKIMIDSGELGLTAECSRVYKHKKYYSTARDADIVADVSVEVTRRGADEPFIIWVWECKNYKHPVPVDDIEELHSKLEQIGADKTKGTLIATGHFQKSSMAYAKSVGIDIARFTEEKKIVYINGGRPRPRPGVHYMIRPAYRVSPQRVEILAFSQDKKFSSLREYIKTTLAELIG